MRGAKTLNKTSTSHINHLQIFGIYLNDSNKKQTHRAKRYSTMTAYRQTRQWLTAHIVVNQHQCRMSVVGVEKNSVHPTDYLRSIVVMGRNQE